MKRYYRWLVVLLFLLAIVCLETSSIALKPPPRSLSLAPKVHNSYKLDLASTKLLNAGWSIGNEAIETSIITWHLHHGVWSYYGSCLPSYQCHHPLSFPHWRAMYMAMWDWRHLHKHTPNHKWSHDCFHGNKPVVPSRPVVRLWRREE